MDITIENIEKICEMLTKHQIDQIKIGDLAITKTQHMIAEQPEPTKAEDDEDLLYYSAN